jgi:hypothetical protein
MVYFHSPVNVEIAEHFPYSGMSNLINGVAIFHFGVNDTVSMLEKRGQIAACDVAILVNSRGQNGPAMLSIPRGVVCAAAEK